jgi:hypothetical protein
MRCKQSNNGLVPKSLFSENSYESTFPEYASIHGSRHESGLRSSSVQKKYNKDELLTPWLQISLISRPIAVR